MHSLKRRLHDAIVTWWFVYRLERQNLSIVLQQEVATDLTLEDVELFFQPGVSAADAPILLNRTQVRAAMVGALLVPAILLYLIVHLSPPLW